MAWEGVWEWEVQEEVWEWEDQEEVWEWEDQIEEGVGVGIQRWKNLVCVRQ